MEEEQMGKYVFTQQADRALAYANYIAHLCKIKYIVEKIRIVRRQQ